MCELHDVASRSFLRLNYFARMFAFIFVRYIYYINDDDDAVNHDNNAMTILTTLISTTNVIREFVTERKDRHMTSVICSVFQSY